MSWWWLVVVVVHTLHTHMRVLTHMDLGAFAFWIIVYPTYWRKKEEKLRVGCQGTMLEREG